jgi:hypothetical protein
MINYWLRLGDRAPEAKPSFCGELYSSALLPLSSYCLALLLVMLGKTMR